MQFGNSTDSRVLAQGKTTARDWALNRVADTKNNYFTVTYTNDTTHPIPFTGTVDDPGPTWRVTGYSRDGAEFHGHARQVGPTAPGVSGTTDLIFEVPSGTPLQRVLLAQGMVDLG